MKCRSCGNVFTEKAATVGIVDHDRSEKIICPFCGSDNIGE